MSGVLNISDLHYPQLLKDLADPPENIYYNGSLNTTIFENCLAVVGSRKISSYGNRVLRNFIPEICLSGITIVSGFMYGVDAVSHTVALEANGKTIAIMPSGLDVVCPADQNELYKKIIDSNNLILSEYAYGTLPKKWTFPRRNRLVAGISKAVLVIEAALDSGSLITARIALKLKRPTFVIPGDIFAQGSEGIYKLVKEGARVVYTPQDIISLYFSSFYKSQIKQLELLDSISKDIYSILQLRSMTMEALLEESKLPYHQVGPVITQLEVAGIISSVNGIYYVN